METAMMIGVAILAIVLFVGAYYYLYKKESYSNGGNDLAWAAGLPGDCSGCGMKNTDFNNKTLYTDTLTASLQSAGTDYYGLPADPIFKGSELQDGLYNKVWHR
jgi:hypothetical protein